jgi:hypothetical protein
MSTTITNPWSYSPAQSITGESTGVIAARRFVKPSGNRTANGNLAVAQAAAGDRPLGVAADDATDAGQLVRIARGCGESRCRGCHRSRCRGPGRHRWRSIYRGRRCHRRPRGVRCRRRRDRRSRPLLDRTKGIEPQCHPHLFRP